MAKSHQFSTEPVSLVCGGEILCNFDKGRNVVARQMGQSISKMRNLVGCSQYAVVYLPNVLQKTTTELSRIHGYLWLIDMSEDCRLAYLAVSHKRASIAYCILLKMVMLAMIDSP